MFNELKVSLNISSSDLSRMRRPEPNPWSVCDKLKVQPNLNVTEDILKALRPQFMPYDRNKYIHRRNSKFHGDAMLTARNYMYEMIQVIPTLHVGIETYHNRSKYNKRKRKKFAYGEHCNHYKLNLLDDNRRFGTTELANFTTEQILQKHV